MKSNAINALMDVMKAYPDLCSGGFRVRGSRVHDGERFKQYRDEMTDDYFVGQFCLALEFLSLQTPTKTATRRWGNGSYGLKHRVENWCERTYPERDHYCANGMFIAAAIASGFPIKRYQDSPNCSVGVSLKTLKRCRQL